jgi:aerobic carbon-monoxide dehydrogenase large subunit
VLTLRLINQRLIPSPIEPRAVLAQYDPSTDKLTLYMSTQIPHVIKRLLAETFNFPEHKLRVIAPDVGGGFGAKLHFYPEELLCAFLTQELHRPVKWLESRNESHVATTHGRDHIQDVELTAMHDGTITGLKVVCYANLGAYQSTMVPGVPTYNFGNLVTGNYKIPVLDETIYCVMTNTTPVDAYCGAGRPEATYLIERMVDLLAREVGMDPVEVRRKNFIQPHEFPYRVITGVRYDSGNYEITLEKALTLISYFEARERQRELRKQRRYLGISVAMYTEICGQAPSRLMGSRGFNRGGWESTTIRVHPTGKVTVYSGSSSHGQGHATSFAQIVADDFGVPIEDVEVVQSDTAQVQFGHGTFNSRSMPVGGSSVKVTAQKVVAKAVKIAAHLLEAPKKTSSFARGSFLSKECPESQRAFLR